MERKHFETFEEMYRWWGDNEVILLGRDLHKKYVDSELVRVTLGRGRELMWFAWFC